MGNLAKAAPKEIIADAEPVERKKSRPAARVVHVKDTAHLSARPMDDDIDAWAAKLKEALGTTSDHFVRASVQQLIQATKLPGRAGACTTSLSAALAFIASLEPETEAQAALAVQLAALFSASMNVLSRVPLVGERSMTTMSSAGAKLARAFQSGLETYYRLKRGVHQVVRIERVEIKEGGQAVIGLIKGA